jgi:LDH2 family malate/lactate/ureidoglycolate dehydrogenase
MTVYPESETDLRVSPGRLSRVVYAIFLRCGMSNDDATLLTESLIHADLRGIHSHGVLRIPDYVKKLTKDGVDPRGRPRVVSERGAAVVVDGGNS